MYHNFAKKQKKGFSTIEMLIAMAVLVMCFSAIILVLFSNQSMLISGQTSSEAINMAQELLEKAQADARKDFTSVNSYAIDTNIGGLTYHKSVAVEQPDLFIKKVIATVSWTGEEDKDLSVQLTALVTDFENAVVITP